MKKYYLSFALLAVSIALISWGGVGHKTVATIASYHLTPKARAAVKALLGDTSMADVASWADEVVRKPDYRQTAPWHYANAPLGLSYENFKKEIESQPNDNVYKALLKSEHVLSHSNNSAPIRVEALKFIIHFVGDLHQPMHVSRAEDKGGNTIQVQYDNKGTNLHFLWDSKLIGTEGKDFNQMAVDYDKATPKQTKEWQSQDPMRWLWESYQISSKLYDEVAQNNKLDNSYYQAHINIVHDRIDMAGIRLAGILNQIFANQELSNGQTSTPPVVKQTSNEQGYSGVKLEDVSKHIGERAAVQGLVADFKHFKNMVLVNLGAPYPNNSLTLVFKGDAIALSQRVIASKGKNILVTGIIVDYNGKPQIEVSNANQLYQAP